MKAANKLSTVVSKLSSTQKFRLTLFAVVLATGAIFWYIYIKYYLWGTDFAYYYQYAHAYISGENIFNLNASYVASWNAPPQLDSAIGSQRIVSNTLRYGYPPISIFIFLPFAYLTLQQGIIVFTALNIIALSAAALLISRILSSYGVSLSKMEQLLTFIAILFFDPVIATLKLGNINIIVFFFITLFFYALYVRNNRTAAALILTIAAFIKIFPIILSLLSFVSKKAKGLFIRCCLFVAGFGILSIGILGISMHIEFVKAFLTFQTNLPISRGLILSSSWPPGSTSLTQSVVTAIALFNANAYYAQIMVLWAIARVVLVLGTLFYLLRKSHLMTPRLEKEWEILSFSVLVVLPLVVSNYAPAGYVMYLIPSFLLLIFVVKLDRIEKVILFASIAVFAARIPLIGAFYFIGGFGKEVINLAYPTNVGFVLFLFLLFLLIHKRFSSTADKSKETSDLELALINS